MLFSQKHNNVHTYYLHIIVAQFVLITVLLDFSHVSIYKQLKKAQKSGDVKISPGPQNPLDLRGLNNDLLSEIFDTLIRLNKLFCSTIILSALFTSLVCTLSAMCLELLYFLFTLPICIFV